MCQRLCRRAGTPGGWGGRGGLGLGLGIGGRREVLARLARLCRRAPKGFAAEGPGNKRATSLLTSFQTLLFPGEPITLAPSRCQPLIGFSSTGVLDWWFST